MTADVETLIALRERVRGARGPDRELDADVMAACFAWAKRGSPYLAPHCKGEEPIYWHAPEPFYKRPVPELSASIEAALALVERCLPGWTWALESTDIPECPYRAAIAIDDDGRSGGAYGYTPALALLAALLAALIVEAEAKSRP